MTQKIDNPEAWIKVPARKPRAPGVECGHCGKRFERKVSYKWTCKDVCCPFDYGPFYEGIISPPGLLGSDYE